MATTPNSSPPEVVERYAPPPSPRPVYVLLRGIAGGLVGAVAGYFLFRYLASRGMLGYAIPGASIGLFAGLAARGQSRTLGAICAIAAVLMAIYCEWASAPFAADGSLSFFVVHLHRLPGLKIKAIITALGAACAYWLGQGR
jgi:hypothetical protein